MADTSKVIRDVRFCPRCRDLRYCVGILNDPEKISICQVCGQIVNAVYSEEVFVGRKMSLLFCCRCKKTTRHARMKIDEEWACAECRDEPA